MDRLLIERLRNRIATGPAIDAQVCPPRQAYPPAAADELAEAEGQLGFALPELVRALYLEVGNGSWGPGYGLLPLTGEGSLAEETLWHISYSPLALGGPGWPPRLIRLVEWGCHYASCVDCSDPNCPVVFYDNDMAILDWVEPSDYLYPESPSLAAWLSDWLDGVDLWAVGPKSKRTEQGASAGGGRDSGSS
jgi:SMI1 / KNR4 family (SUKH-1)